MLNSPNALERIESVDFLCIGAQKSGTTYITNAFRNHPEIQLPGFKELYFFSPKGEYQANGNFAQCNADKDIDWYKDQFIPDHRKKGEISTSYLLDPASADRIKLAFPEIKIFAILRNPVQRAFSQYNMERYWTGKEKRSLLQIIREEPDNEILTRGLYFHQLEPFTRRFGNDQLKVCLFDDMTSDPASFFNDLFTFVGADASFRPPELDKKANKRRGTKYPFIPRSIRFVRRTLEVVGLRSFVRALNRKGAGRWVRIFNKRYNEKEIDVEMSADERAALQEFYLADIEQLEKLLDRKLPHWKSQHEAVV